MHSANAVAYVVLCVAHHEDILANDSIAVQVHLLAKHISKSDDEIERAITRPTYFNPYEAVDFGIIDKVGDSYSVLLCRLCMLVLLPVHHADLHGNLRTLKAAVCIESGD